MRVFLTGATGFIGSAIIPELISAGHQVIGLARSEAAAALVVAAGAEAHRGALDDLDSLRAGASAADGVIHCGFIHDFSDIAKSCEVDRAAIETMGAALAGSGRPFVNTTGVALLPQGKLGTEEDAADPHSPAAFRVPSEELGLALAKRGVRASVVRLSPSVHGVGDHGFIPALIGVAREKGVSAYIGDGENRWPGVHRLDAARLYRLAVEKAPAGARLHGVADEGVPTREIAEVVGRRLGLPVVSVAKEEAAAHFGWIGHFFAIDIVASSALTQERLGWRPEHPGLIADLDQPAYFGG